MRHAGRSSARDLGLPEGFGPATDACDSVESISRLPVGGDGCRRSLALRTWDYMRGKARPRGDVELSFSAMQAFSYGRLNQGLVVPTSAAHRADTLPA